MNFARWSVVFAVLALYFAPSSVLAEPPKVVKAAPDMADTDVDPTLDVIRIEFDQDMNTRGFSICGGGATFPKVNGKVAWESPRILRMNVTLQPGHFYQYSINCPGNTSTQSATGEPAEIYPIAFKTAAANAPKKEKLTPEINQKAIETLRKAIEERYSYRFKLGDDWPKTFDRLKISAEATETSSAFAREIAKLLGEAKDLHVWVKVDTFTIATLRRNVMPNVNERMLMRIVPNWRNVNQVLATGKYDDEIGYILIRSWAREAKPMLEQVQTLLDEYANCKCIILDVRPNGGGDESLAQAVAARFVDKQAVYGKHAFRDLNSADGFTKPSDRVIAPSQTHTAIKAKVAVLMGTANVSSCESFLLMMKQAGNCKLIGERSFGSSGNPQPIDLGNGVIVFLPSWKSLLPDGSLLEGVGVTPDIEVTATPADFQRGDPVLEKALQHLRGN